MSRPQLFSLLSDSELGTLAADGFSLLMSDSVDILNRGCHADVRIMYRQRFFTENSAKLVQGFNSAPAGTNNRRYPSATYTIIRNEKYMICNCMSYCVFQSPPHFSHSTREEVLLSEGSVPHRQQPAQTGPALRASCGE